MRPEALKARPFARLSGQAGPGKSLLGSREDRRFRTVQRIVWSLLNREKLCWQIEDRHEAIRLISLVINDPYGGEPEQFQLSCRWAIYIRNIGHPTTLTAYQTAMSLMQKSLSFAPTVSVQHACLVAMGEDCHTMPLDHIMMQKLADVLVKAHVQFCLTARESPCGPIERSGVSCAWAH